MRLARLKQRKTRKVVQTRCPHCPTPDVASDGRSRESKSYAGAAQRLTSRAQ